MEALLRMGLPLKMQLLKEIEDEFLQIKKPRIEKKKRVGTFYLLVVQGLLFCPIVSVRVMPGLILLLNTMLRQFW